MMADTHCPRCNTDHVKFVRIIRAVRTLDLNEPGATWEDTGEDTILSTLFVCNECGFQTETTVEVP
jgi:hypothetical protein